MTSPRSIQTWFSAFVVLVGLLSLLPYRERALLPVPSANEQGFLAREITQDGPDQLVGDAITGTSGGPSPIGSVSGSGARRLIPGLIRAAAVPGTTTLADVIGAAGPAGAGIPGEGGGPAQSGAAAGEGGTANLAAAQGGVGNSPAGPVGNNPALSGPQGPTVLAGTAGQLLAAVVPEPSTWLLFVSGLMAVGWGLRRRALPMPKMVSGAQ